MLVFNQREQRKRRLLLRRTSTFCEKILWEKLRDGQLGIRFRRQFGIGNYVVDFYAPRARLAIEIDGPVHQLRNGYDRLRQQEIEGLGIAFLRFTNDEVSQGLEQVVKVISSKIPLLTKERDKG